MTLALHILGYWTLASIAFIPVWSWIKRHDRAYQRATGWWDDFNSYSAQGKHPHAECAPASTVQPLTPDVGATYQVTA